MDLLLDLGVSDSVLLILVASTHRYLQVFKGRFKKACICLSTPVQMQLTSHLEIPPALMEATRVSTFLV